MVPGMPHLLRLAKSVDRGQHNRGIRVKTVAVRRCDIESSLQKQDVLFSEHALYNQGTLIRRPSLLLAEPYYFTRCDGLEDKGMGCGDKGLVVSICDWAW